MCPSTAIEAAIGQDWGLSYLSPFQWIDLQHRSTSMIAQATFLFAFATALSSAMISRQGRCHSAAAHSMLNTKNFRKSKTRKNYCSKGIFIHLMSPASRALRWKTYHQSSFSLFKMPNGLDLAKKTRPQN